MITMHVKRKWGGGGKGFENWCSTISEFYIKEKTDGTALCVLKGYTLEPLGPDTVEPNKNKRIPQGKFRTEGCLLVGTTNGVDYVDGSVAKLKELKCYLEKVGIENVAVIIRNEIPS
jgi:hypothetical protein